MKAKKLSLDNQLMLVYLKSGQAQFVLGGTKNMNADDTDDAPYEHNCGGSYNWNVIVHYSIPNNTYLEPRHGNAGYEFDNSPYSVDDMTAHKIPWLRSFPDKELPPIMANMPVEVFVSHILAVGGEIKKIEPASYIDISRYKYAGKKHNPRRKPKFKAGDKVIVWNEKTISWERGYLIDGNLSVRYDSYPIKHENGLGLSSTKLVNRYDVWADDQKGDS